MDFFNELMGGGQRQQEYQDFADRYDQGAPYDRIPDEEAAGRYQEVAPQLSQDDYEQSARESFSRMEPEERMQFGQQLRDQANQQNYDFPDQGMQGQDERFQDPNYLAQVTGQIHRDQPDLIGQLLGGGGGGMLGGMLGGGGITGGQGASGGGSGMMGNPAVKAALSGIAAMAVKRMMQR